MNIRKAQERDLGAVSAIYEAIIDREERGESTVGWLRGVYPTEATARAALEKGELYVMEDEGRIVASARINGEQCEEYSRCPWLYDVPPAQVLVCHTLTVDPAVKSKGCGTAFVAFYEETARSLGCTALRIDTNARNEAGRRLYAHLGYREAGIVPTVFNGIPGVQLVCLEKRV